MLDLRTVVIESLDRLLASGEVEKSIDEAVKACVGGIIKSQLRDGYSDFGKQLEEVVKKALALNGEIELAPYNVLVTKIVQQQLDTFTRETAAKQVGERVRALLETPPAERKLSKLVESYLEHVANEARNSCRCHGDNEITVHFTDQRDGFAYLHLDSEPRKKSNECRIRIGLHHNKVFSLSCGGYVADKAMFAGTNFYGFEKALFDMYAGGTMLVFDEDPSDLGKCYELAHD